MPNNKIKQFFFKIIQNRIFDSFVMFCIISNIFTMAMPMEGSSAQYNNILDNINLFFTGVFMMELTLKMTALGITTYFKNAWN